jgi:hypothetical protein
MANPNPVNQITPETRARMPGRGRNKRTLILEAIRESASLSLTPDATNDDTEKAVFAHLAESAFSPVSELQKDQSSTCLSILMKKGWPDLKPQDPMIEFEFDSSGSPLQKANQLFDAISKGFIPPSTGLSLINAMASVMKIEEVTEIRKEIERIKDKLGIADV